MNMNRNKHTSYYRNQSQLFINLKGYTQVCVHTGVLCTMFCPPELAFPTSCWSAVSFIQFPAIMRVHFLFSDLLFRYVVPPVPVNPMSDLYPGAGAGIYPTGYAS